MISHTCIFLLYCINKCIRNVREQLLIKTDNIYYIALIMIYNVQIPE